MFISSQLYLNLTKIDEQQNQQLGQAIAAMAAALSPTKGFTLKAA